MRDWGSLPSGVAAADIMAVVMVDESVVERGRICVIEFAQKVVAKVVAFE